MAETMRNKPRNMLCCDTIKTNGKGILLFENDDGSVSQYVILCAFYSKKAGKDYLIYSDESVNSDGDVELMAASYLRDGDQIFLDPVESEDEWAIVQSCLDSLLHEIGEE